MEGERPPWRQNICVCVGGGGGGGILDMCGIHVIEVHILYFYYVHGIYVFFQHHHLLGNRPGIHFVDE